SSPAKATPRANSSEAGRRTVGGGVNGPAQAACMPAARRGRHRTVLIFYMWAQGRWQAAVRFPAKGPDTGRKIGLRRILQSAHSLGGVSATWFRQTRYGQGACRPHAG